MAMPKFCFGRAACQCSLIAKLISDKQLNSELRWAPANAHCSHCVAHRRSCAARYAQCRFMNFVWAMYTQKALLKQTKFKISHHSQQYCRFQQNTLLDAAWRVETYVQHAMRNAASQILFMPNIPQKAFYSKLNSRCTTKFSNMPGAKQMRVWLLCGTPKFICSATLMVLIPEFCLGLVTPKRPLTAN